MSGYTINATGQLNLGSSTGVVRFDSDCSFSNPGQVRRETAPAKLVYVESLADLPDPSGNVITLEPGVGYYLTGRVDLAGNRLVGGDAENTIFGSSSETSWLTSTGLPAGEPLISSNFTLPLVRFSLHDVDTALEFDDLAGANAPLALDFDKFNIVDVSNIGTIGTVDNLIITNSAFINSSNLILTGSVGTFGLSDSIFTNFRPGNTIDLSGSTITRRFRSNFCSFVKGSTGASINYSGVTVPEEGIILNTVNFSGSGVDLSGIDADSVYANFAGCQGITNSVSVGDVYVTANTTETTITTADVPVPLDAAITSTSPNLKKFVAEPGVHGLRYISSIPKTFLVSLNCSLSTAVNQEKTCGLYIATHDVSDIAQGSVAVGDVTPATDGISTTEIYNTTSSARDVAYSTQYLVELTKDTLVYPIIENITDTENIVVSFMNMIIQKTSE
jgi:hypothetical protein